MSPPPFLRYKIASKLGFLDKKSTFYMKGALFKVLYCKKHTFWQKVLQKAL
jgi:hypothetical protein